MPVLAEVAARLMGGWDIDRAQLAALARVQRRSGIGMGAAASSGGGSRAGGLTATMYLRFALFAVLGLVAAGGGVFPSFFLGMTFTYTLVMLMFGLTFLSYFTTVLLDTSDNRILLHLPISGRTLLAARIAYVAKYAGLLVLSISLPAAIVVAARFGAVALLVFGLSLVLTLIFVVAVALALCFFSLRFVGAARIRQAILYLETGLFVLAVYAATTVLTTDVSLAQMVPDLSGDPGWFFYPPGWMAGLLDYLLMESTRFNAALAALAVLVPLSGFVGCFLFFGGGRFTALLSRLEVVPRDVESTRKTTPGGLGRLFERISALLNGDRQQRAVFDLTAKLMRKDQPLNLTALPYIGTVLVSIGFVVKRFYGQPVDALPLNAEFAFFMSYYLPLILAVIAPWIRYGADWRAAWCYRVLPFSRAGVILSGAMKAYFRRYLLPIYLLVMVVCAGLWGVVPAVDVLFAGAVATLICVYRFWSTEPAPPYSKERVGGMPQEKSTVLTFTYIPLALALIAAHVTLKAIFGLWGVLGGIVVIGVVIGFAYSKLQSMDSRSIGVPDVLDAERAPAN